jgi:hypothetical protein
MGVRPPPHGWTEMLEVFGNIRRYVRTDGTLSPGWEMDKLTTVGLPAPLPLSWDLETHVKRIRCHVVVAAPLTLALSDVYAQGLWGELRTFGGCFEFRKQRDSSTKLSGHAFGAAVDFDPEGNRRGTQGRLPVPVAAIFERHGFQWGGHWDGARRDPMHFQYFTGY